MGLGEGFSASVLSGIDAAFVCDLLNVRNWIFFLA